MNSRKKTSSSSVLRSLTIRLSRLTRRWPSKKRVSTVWSSTKTQSKKKYGQTTKYINRHPLRSFYITLGVFVLLIVFSSLFRKTESVASTPKQEPKQVSIYHIGSAPKITVQAQIEKSGVVKIVALSSGIVNKLYKHEGETVNAGQTLVGLSSNYSGGNTFSLQRQIAQKQYDTVVDTYDTQKDIIQKQRDIADKTSSNAALLRDITSKSLDETRGTINANEDILNTLNQNLQTLIAQNATNDALLPLKSQIAQLQAATNQAKQGLRSAEYAAAGDKPPTDLSNISKDLMMKQLDLQAKALDVNKEVSHIQLQIAQVTEATMYPSAPFNATVQRVFVKEGENVNPGTQLMVLTQIGEDPINAIAYVPSSVAEKVSMTEESIIHIGAQTFNAVPSFVSTEAVSGLSYAVYYRLPDSYAGKVTDSDFVSIEIPVGTSDTSSSLIYVPIDSVYQTASESYVFVVYAGKAVSRKVSLGDIYGGFAPITSGLKNGDEVITTRNVIADDPVTVSEN